MSKLLTRLLLSLLMFTPAPEINPGEPFVFDPALCPSSAMLAVIIPVGVTHNGELDVGEEDGESITFATSLITIDPIGVTVLDTSDPRFPNAVVHTHKWTWTPDITNVGLNYINVKVMDSWGASDPNSIRTIVVLVKVNRPPVIVGCR